MCVFQFSIVTQLSDIKEIKTFDPFEILGIEKGATDKEIKKAYRMQSLVYHPDKNPDNPNAQAVFIKITKAYNALTDPQAKEMYEKYGNPDGAGTMRTGIGLPRFMLENENKVPILILFAVVLLFAIPALGILHYTNTRYFAANGVLLDSLQLLGQSIGNKNNLQKCPELIAACSENLLLPVCDQDFDDLEKVSAEVHLWNEETIWDFDVIRRNHILLLAHLQRKTHLLSDRLKTVLDKILGASDKLMASMLEIASLQLWKNRTIEMLTFRRCMMQQLGQDDSSLMQIPGFTRELVDKAEEQDCDGVQNFIDLSKAERKALTGWSEEQLLEANDFIRHLPQIDLDFDVWVDDEDEVVEGDIVTVKIKMNRKNLHDDESAGPIYSPGMPNPVFEQWWLLISVNENPKWTLVEKAREQEKEVVKTCYVQLSTAGTHKFTVQAMCDVYAGLDRTVVKEITAKAEDAVDREIIIHKEDEDLDKMPTLFESMMGLGPEEEDSSDDEDEGKKDGGMSPVRKIGHQTVKVVGESAKEAGMSDVSSVLSSSDGSDSDDGDSSSDEE